MEVTFEQNIDQYDVGFNQEPITFEVVFSELGEKGPKGDKGDSGDNYIDLQLVVNFDGQTEFSVFTIPNKSNLLINGSEYFENIHYSVTMVGLNATLIWTNTEFQFSMNDNIIFRKYQ